MIPLSPARDRSRFATFAQTGRRTSPGAFTLVELLAVTAIVAILAGLLIPAVTYAVNKTRETRCLSNLRTLNLGIALYGTDNNTELPVYSTSSTSGLASAPDSLNAGWWHRRIASYLQLTFQAIDSTHDSIPAQNRVFLCPSDTDPFGGALSFGINGWLAGYRRQSIQTNPILLIESSSYAAFHPEDLKYNHGHGDLINVLFLDGSVRQMKDVPSNTDDPSLWIPRTQ